MTAAVLVENLQKSYGNVRAVKDISFRVNSQEIFGLLGPNGSGKTTTLRCLCTLSKPDEGKISIGNTNAIVEPKLARQRLGYVAQEVAIDKVLTGRELLRLQAALYHIPRKFIDSRIDQLIEALGLEDYADRKTGTYSGGIRKRLDLAAGLLHQPEILVLDEPTVGLDIESRQLLWDFLRQLKSAGTSILLTSHYLEEVDALADRLAIIDQGLVIAEGTPSELKSQVGGDRVTLKIREFTPESEANKAKSLLENLPFVESVLVNKAQGNSLNLVVQSGTKVLTQIEQSLTSLDFPTFSLAQSRPSLDDVYLAATGKTLLDAEIAASSIRDIKQEKKQQMK